MSLLRGIATVGGYTMASRVLGFVRDVLTAAYLGAGPVADAFFVAFKFPNFFRRLFAEGAFNAAFVPLFAGMVAKDGRVVARNFAEDAMAVLIAVLLGLTIVVETLMPQFIALVAPGFRDEPDKFALAVEFTRITFPYLLFISLVSLQGGVLNSLDRFAAVAATPIVLNLCMISALVGLTRVLPSAGVALSWGVALAGLAQFLWLAVACDREGMALRLPLPRLTPEVRSLLRLMLPAALGSGVVQVNLLVDVMIASLLPTGAVSFLYYADRLYELPLAVIGIAIGTAILPLLSRQIRLGETVAAGTTQNRALEIALILTLPATVALIVLAQPIIATLFERGAFGDATTRETARALVAYSLGLPAYVLIKVLAPCYYARQDTRTPVKIAVLCVAVNTAVALVLMQVVAHVGIALATAASAWLNAALLARGLLARGAFALEPRTRARGLRALAASLAMGAALLGGMQLAGPLLAIHGVIRWAALAGLVALGLVAYAAAGVALGAFAPRELLRTLRRPAS
ncbi:MAG: murein biosynthesis integral membrane protein MurJ [Alphaproteobacteria bacterium]|nr:murein biosynthesis integral membrane protein MurJ [Alphaproteobacteria bacterium]